MTRPVVWIAGGTDKGNDYEPLKAFARAKVHTLVCMGADNTKLIEEFTGVVPEVVSTGSLDAAMEAAKAAAQPGDAVLLSPACASFDLFKNYENRGELFKAWVNERHSTMKLGERKYTQDEGPAQEPLDGSAEIPRAADGRPGRRTPRRRGVRGTDTGESACETPEAPENTSSGFTGDRVLWIIVAALAVISVLVVLLSTAKMAYDAHTARTTAHFLRQQLIILVVSLIIMVAVQKINCRIYNLFSRPVYFLSVALTVAVYFIGATTNGAARWIPSGRSSSSPPRR